MPHPPIILASASPRRRALLRQIGLEFDVRPSHADETLPEDVPPIEHVLELAERKAREVGTHVSQGIILAADTIVVIDGDILNKPVDKADAVRMLKHLSGVRHEVFTGFCLLEIPSRRIVCEHERTEVWFRRLDDGEIIRYVEGGGPMDKAGAYGIQEDFGAVFVEKIHGDFYNVVGLPLSHFYRTFKRFVYNGQ